MASLDLLDILLFLLGPPGCSHDLHSPLDVRLALFGPLNISMASTDLLNVLSSLLSLHGPPERAFIPLGPSECPHGRPHGLLEPSVVHTAFTTSLGNRMAFPAPLDVRTIFATSISNCMSL